MAKLHEGGARIMLLAALTVVVCALLTACSVPGPSAPSASTSLTETAKTALMQACAHRESSSASPTSQPTTVVVLVWNGTPVRGAVPISLTGPQGVGALRTAKNGCYRVTHQDRCLFGRACDLNEVAVARYPFDEDDDANLPRWGHPTDDTWFPETVDLPAPPEQGVNGVVVPLAPASTARGRIGGLPAGRAGTVYLVDSSGQLARAQGVPASKPEFTLGGLRPGRYRLFCTAGDAFPYDLPGPDTPTGSTPVELRPATAPDRPTTEVPTCRPTGSGSPELHTALVNWDRNAGLAR